MNLSLPLAFAVGLLSTLHCLGMCGGVMGALTFGLPVKTRSDWRRFALFLLAYNLGRVGSYALAGALMGGLGAALLGFLAGGSGHDWLRGLAALIMVGIGLHIAGWFPQFARLERVGAPLWRRLEPAGRRLLPVDSLTRAMAYGIIWGWIPCGLVYTMLMSTAAQEGMLAGALYMGAFGLGTLPSLIATGLLAGRLYRFARRPGVQRLVGLSVVLMGLLTLGYREAPGRLL